MDNKTKHPVIHPTHTPKKGVFNGGVSVWPYPDLVKMSSVRGIWRWKYKGKYYYFGSVNNPDAALAAWRSRYPSITGQAAPVIPVASLTVQELSERWYANQCVRARDGVITQRTAVGYLNHISMFNSAVGSHRLAQDLVPEDFARAVAGREDSPHYRRAYVVMIRAMFTWGVENRLIERMPAFGSAFDAPGLRQFRQHREGAGRRDIEAAALWRLIRLTALSHDLSAMVWLGINAALGVDDCMDLPASAIKGDVLTWRRPKTGIIRIATLWPETLAAIKAVRNDGDGRVFPVRNERRSFHTWRVVFDLAGLPDRQFYDLRRTFATVAAEYPDMEAREIVMGHSIDAMSETYIQKLMPGRCRAVCDHVRAWLLAGQPAPSLESQPAPLAPVKRGRVRGAGS